MCKSVVTKHAAVLAAASGTPPMRKLIRSRATNSFLMSDLSWTDDISKAADVPDYTRACVLARELNLDDVELYYWFGYQPESQYDFAVRLR